MFARLGKWDLHFYIKWGRPLNFNATSGRLIALISKGNINCKLQCNTKLSRQLDLLSMLAIYSATFSLPAKAGDHCE